MTAKLISILRYVGLLLAVVAIRKPYAMPQGRKGSGVVSTRSITYTAREED